MEYLDVRVYTLPNLWWRRHLENVSAFINYESQLACVVCSESRWPRPVAPPFHRGYGYTEVPELDDDMMG